jgi:hypothetical protein
MISTILKVILGLVTSPEFLIITAITVLAVALVVQVADPTGGGSRKKGRRKRSKIVKNDMPPIENEGEDEEEDEDE